MTTKGYCVPDKLDTVSAGTLSGQYSNLNLNSNHSLLNHNTVYSKSVQNNGKKAKHFGKIMAAVLFFKSF